MKHFIQISRVLAAKKLYLFVLVMLMSIGAKAGTKEVYTSFKESSGTLTYYYDDKRESRTSSGEITEIYDPVNKPDALRFKNYNSKVKKAKIDASMKNAHLTSTKRMFYGYEEKKTTYLVSHRLEKMTSIEGMENLITDEVTDMQGMFDDCESLTSIDLSHFNTGNVTDMQSMFAGCKSLTALDLSHFNTENVENMAWMFCSCESMVDLDLSTFNTDKVTSFLGMFSNCYALPFLDLSSFNTGNVTNMGSMFRKCQSLGAIRCAKDWSQSAVLENSGNMFQGCTLLIGEKGTTCDGKNHIDVAYARPDGGESKPGYFTSGIRPKEVYTSFNESKGTLTYYYDDQRATRTAAGEITEVYDPGANRFKKYHDKVKKAKIDVSMKDTLLTTTRNMFLGYETNFAKQSPLSKMTEIEGLENLITDNVTDMTRMFSCCSSLKSLDLSHFNTAKVKDMREMFSFCSKLTSLNLSSFNTANVTNMSDMFSYCESLKSLDLSHFNTEKVTDMMNMFAGCSSLKSLDLSSFNTAKVGNMFGLVQQCSSLTSLDLSHFNTENVEYMRWMFRGCTSLKSVDLKNFSTGKVKSLEEMFQGCSSLTTIHCNNDWYWLSTTALENSDNIFAGCTKLKGMRGTTYSKDNPSLGYARPDGGSDRPGYFTNEVELYTAFDYETETLTYYYNNERSMHTGFGEVCELYTPEKGNDLVRFEGYADQVKRVIIDESFKAAPVSSLANMFDGGSDNTRLTALETIDGLENINFSGVTSMYRMFKGCSSLKSIDLTPLHDAGQVQDLSFMFEDCSSLLHLDLSALSTANVTTMYSLCAGCSSLRNAVLYAFSTANVTDMGSMFLNCSSLTSLDMRSFDTEKVEWMPGMFSGCSSLESVKLSSFNTANVESMSEMFKDCASLKTLDLRSFKTDKVRVMDWMFKGCSNLTTILCLDDWTTSQELPYSYDMFDGCFELVGYQGTACNGNLTDITYARLDGGESKPGYFSTTNEVYTVYDSETATLTYYCDDQRLFRTDGVVELYDPDDVVAVRFKGYNEEVQTIVMDESMKGALLTSMRSMFYGGSEFDEPTGSYIHYSLSNAKEIDGFGLLVTDKVTDMSYMFYGCASLQELDFVTFNTANVWRMDHMFEGCSNLSTIYCYENWSASERLTSSDDMFAGCYVLVGGESTSCDGENTIDKAYARPDGIEGSGYFTAVKKLYTVFEEEIATLTYYYDNELALHPGVLEYYTPQKGHDIVRFKGYADKIKYVVIDPSMRKLRLKSLANMFDGMTALESIVGLDFIDYCAVTDMYAMFRNCASLQELDVTPVKTARVKNFNGMFYGCSSLKELDVTGFEIGSARDMSNMFAYCTKLKTLRADRDWSKYGMPCTDMFFRCTSLVGRKGTRCNGYDQVTNMLARPDGINGNPGYFTQSLASSRKGFFTINEEGDQIQFSPGNLQFNAAKGSHECADGKTQKGTWRFAPNQWTCVGYDNGNISESYNGWIDLFGWATSGWDSGAKAYQPWSSSTDYTDYLDAHFDLNDGHEYADWGVYNQIGDDAPGTWRTLTTSEWKYLLNERSLAGNLRGHGVVNGVRGYILLPDDWITPNCLSFEWGTDGYPGTTDWYANVFNGKDWEAMEEAGAIFLPAAGFRNGTDAGGMENYGYYWSGHRSAVYGFYFFFMSSDASTSSGYYNSYGRSVRLVKAYESKPEITVEEQSGVVELTVTITPPDIDSKVYYKVVLGDTKYDGEDISAEPWLEYTAPFEIDPSVDYGESKYYTILAYSVSADGVKSDIAAEEYGFSMPPKLKEPVITTNYNSSLDESILVMMSAESGASIRYKTLITDYQPSDNVIMNFIVSDYWDTYQGAFYVFPSTPLGKKTYVTIVAYAWGKDAIESETTIVKYEFSNPVPPTAPQISSDYSGEGAGSVTITINAEEGTTIWYKTSITGGSGESGEDDNAWKQYGEPVTINIEVDYGETKYVTVMTYAENEGVKSDIEIEEYVFSKPAIPDVPVIISDYESPEAESVTVLITAEDDATIYYAVIPLSYDENGKLIDITDYSQVEFTQYDHLLDIVPQGEDGTTVAYKVVAYAEREGVQSGYSAEIFEFALPEVVDAPVITSDYKDPKAESATITVSAEEGAEIWYKVIVTDEKPTESDIESASWQPYTNPVTVTPGVDYGETKYVTILAYGEKNGVQSETATTQYIFSKPAIPEMPVITSDYSDPQDGSVTVTVTAGQGTEIWYKVIVTDEKPTESDIESASWQKYTDPFTVTPDVGEGETKYVTILTYADNDGVPSETATAQYVFSKPEPVVCPEFMLVDEKGEPVGKTLYAVLGEPFAAPTVKLLTEGYQFSVSYSSSNEEVAFINDMGEIEIVGVGDAVIFANVIVEGISKDECPLDYLTYNLQVMKPEDLEPLPDDQVTTFDFSVYDSSSESEILGITLGATDKFNVDKDRVEITTTNSVDEIDAKLNDAFEGTALIKSLLPGTITFELGAGEGTIEIDCQTLPGYTIKVRIAEYGEAYITSTVEQALRGKATVTYSVAQKTYVVIYLEGTSEAAAPARIARSEKEGEDAGAYIYSITITPKKASQGIDDVQSDQVQSTKVFMDGMIYILRDGKIFTPTGVQVK